MILDRYERMIARRYLLPSKGEGFIFVVAGFRVVHAPGHTPGHCMFFRESDRVCIAGDVLANINVLTGKSGLRQPPKKFSTNAAQNRRSIQLLADLNPSIVCFGHGPPLREPRLLTQYAAALRQLRPQES